MRSLACLLLLSFAISCKGENADGGDSDSGSTGGSTGASASMSSTTQATTSTDGSATSSSTTTSADSTGTTASATESGGSESEGGGVPPTPCTQTNDCEIVDDCCTCAGKHKDDDPVLCDIDCKAPLCEANMVDGAVECVSGQCQLVEQNCDAMQAACAMPPPDCLDGWLPTVDNGCWTGLCVPAQACDVVPDCSWCGPFEVCLDHLGRFSSWTSCIPIAPDCAGTPTCACMAGACEEPTPDCMESDRGLTCTCDAC